MSCGNGATPAHAPERKPHSRPAHRTDEGRGRTRWETERGTCGLGRKEPSWGRREQGIGEEEEFGTF